jgi:hypothetical protein
MGRSRMLNATTFEALDTSCQTFVLGSGGEKGERISITQAKEGKEQTLCAVWGLSAQGSRDVFHLAQSQDMRRDGDLGLKWRKDVLTSELHARCRVSVSVAEHGTHNVLKGGRWWLGTVKLM